MIARFAPLVLGIAWLGLIACGEPGRSPVADVSHSRDRASRNHGIRVGDAVASQDLECTDGEIREVGRAGREQLVTFATVGDCSDCDRHLAGLSAIWQQRAISMDQFVVAYVPTARRPEALRGVLRSVRQPICFDGVGALWMAYDITHTPVTAFVRSGRVVYMADGPLDSVPSREALLRELRALGAD